MFHEGKHIDFSNENEAFVFNEWSTDICASVGAYLLQAFLSCAKNQNEELYFTHQKIYSKGKKIGMILASDEFLALTDDNSQKLIIPKLLPMVIPPKPWTSIDSGGFLTFKCNFCV